MKKRKVNKVGISKLAWKCNKSQFKFKSTKYVKPNDDIIGQPRALESIKLGAKLHAKGYNIFVTGLSGTGRMTAVKRMLDSITSECPLLYDLTYVNNFEKPENPVLIRLPKGKGKQFADSMKEAMIFLNISLPKLFEDENYINSKKKISEKFQKKEADVIIKFDKYVQSKNFVRGQLETENNGIQPEVFPIIEGKAVHIDGVDDFVVSKKITPKEAIEMKKSYIKLRGKLLDMSRENMKIMKEFRQEIKENDKKNTKQLLDENFNDILNLYAQEKVVKYIEEVKKYILNNLYNYLSANLVSAGMGHFEGNKSKENRIDLENDSIFFVNVILDNSNTNSAPLIIERSPTYSNLFGSFDRVFDKQGYWRTDFTKIRAGSLLQADQGFLIVSAQDLYSEVGVWASLKRVLLYNKLEIQPLEVVFQVSQGHLKPEPINMNVKIVIIGGQSLYTILYRQEKGFKKIFKIHAQFDYETKKTEEMIENYVSFISNLCHTEDLPHFSPDGVSAIIEWGVEHAGSQDRISLKFSDIADLIRESAYFFNESYEQYVSSKDVIKAIEHRKMRANLPDEKLLNQIIDGDVLIDTQGERIGQINGLTVMSNGLFTFGKPARITATVSAGNSGIVNIEREVKMSGAIHNKGVMIISGFLRDRFAKEFPLSLSASIAFEQNYSGIDGDSASAAEICLIFSALLDIPINQSLAITGSMNQKGDIQPIGGVNEKITGFYDICKQRGFSSKQGVVIPSQNVKDLMLNSEIIQSVKNKEFTIYSVCNIEEAVELMLSKIYQNNDIENENNIGYLAYKKFEYLNNISRQKN